ncbi:MAG: GSCFA domain-containing protein [Bacteroidaceae bacterium]|nr:GSCFA domain-containing protein [Bacteroidaceae bacterium]
MKLNTPVEIKPLDKRLTYSDSILFVGSCFADEIGNRCAERYFDTRVNPFGVLFNPCSISDCLGLLEGYGINAEQCSFIPEDVIETTGGFCSFHHHGSMARPTAQEFLDNANKVLADSSAFYYREGWVVVTLGTAFIYTDKETGNVVANCHKLPADRFERTMISADQVYEALSQYVAARPGRQWIFTVSPVRHLADGLHANTLSKATLHLGIEKLVNRYPNAHYFPAYEILMDELRDYRFYADDMMHPTQQAADYIFERFMDFALADSDRPLLAEAGKVRGMMEHRILNPGTPEAARFEVQRTKALDSFLQKIHRRQ